MRVLVLGASGFIGRWVARALSGQGARVQAIARDAAVTEEVFADYGIDAELIELDVTDFDRLTTLVHQLGPQIIFNLAGYGVDRSERDESTAFKVNAHLPRELARAVAPLDHTGWSGQRIVHVGSALEYGEIGGDLAEDSTTHPTTLYGRSKLAGTLLLRRCCERLGVNCLTARLFTIYGPGEHPGRLLPSLIDAAQTDEPLELTAGLQRRDFTYVEDVAEGLLRLGLTRSAPSDIVNVATGKLRTVKEFVQTAAAILGIPDDRLRFGALPTRREEMAHDPVSIGHLRALVGWSPSTPLDVGIEKTVEHRRQGLR